MPTSNSFKTSVSEGVRLIKFNRPNRKNAWPTEMYAEIASILNEDAVDDSIVLTIFTGEGEYYSSGNDFGIHKITGEYGDMVVSELKIVENFVNVLIDYPKLLIAIVNGPAIGFAVTTLALFDVVYASERATFTTPFVNLGLNPEGCSSYLFPRIMGRSRASEMLLLGKKMTAEEAHRCGFVAEVYPHTEFEKLFQRLQQYGDLPVNTVKNAKELLRISMCDTLRKTNKLEMDKLIKAFHSEEFLTAYIKLNSKNKL